MARSPVSQRPGTEPSLRRVGRHDSGLGPKYSFWTPLVQNTPCKSIVAGVRTLGGGCSRSGQTLSIGGELLKVRTEGNSASVRVRVRASVSARSRPDKVRTRQGNRASACGCVRACLLACVRASVYMCACVRTCVPARARVRACVRVCVCACVCQARGWTRRRSGGCRWVRRGVDSDSDAVTKEKAWLWRLDTCMGAERGPLRLRRCDEGERH